MEQQPIAAEGLGRACGRLRPWALPHFDPTWYGLVGRSAGMLRVLDAIASVRRTRVPLVIWGETGTGKEVVARAVHRTGPHSSGPFVPLSCGALLEAGLLELTSDAVGDRLGALARAERGTLLIDEVAALSPAAQVRLLRLLREITGHEHGRMDRPVRNVRIITTSKARLSELVRRGELREDLRCELDVLELGLPPLRAHLEDIPALSRHFLEAFAEHAGRPAKRLTPKARAKLFGHSWPGNVRELEHVLLRASLFGGASSLIGPGDLHTDSH